MVKSKVSTLLILILIASAGLLLGRVSVGNVSADGATYENLKVFTEVISMVKKHYVEEVEPQKLVYGAIKGMLNTLDPHSSFMTPDAYKEMQVDTQGEFGGLGIQISVKDSILTVISPIEDTPAFKAGIKAGDKIIKIAGESTKDMSLHDAVNKMRGAPKTSITISIIREGWKEPKDFSIVREIIKIKSVKFKVLDNSIGYVKLLQFQQKTSEDLSAALKDLSAKDINSLILDLRNNPGGLLNSAIDISGQFLPKGKLVVYTQTRSGEKTEYLTEQNGSFSLPMIVLVNEGSASASEIVAGALRDWDRAVILGTQSFGKGSVQTVIPLSDGAGLRLTTAKYYTPKGKSIQNTGIKPDIEVKLATKQGDTHPAMREKDLERHLNNEQQESAPDEADVSTVVINEADDAQLQRAIDLLKTWKVFKGLPAK